MQKRRASLNDFDRFKVMLAKIKVVIEFFKILMFLHHLFDSFSSLQFIMLTSLYIFIQRGGAIRQELAKLKKENAA